MNQSPMSQAQRANIPVRILNSNSAPIKFYFTQEAKEVKDILDQIFDTSKYDKKVEDFYQVLLNEINRTQVDGHIRILDENDVPLIHRLVQAVLEMQHTIAEDFDYISDFYKEQIIEILFKYSSKKFNRKLIENAQTFVDAEKGNMGAYSKIIRSIYVNISTRAYNLTDVIRVIDDALTELIDLTIYSIHNSALTNSNALRCELMGEYLKRYQVNGVLEAYDFQEFIYNAEFMPSKTASKTIILRVDFNSDKIPNAKTTGSNAMMQKKHFIKTFPLYPGYSSLNTLIVEGKMYMELNKLIENNVMPNVLCAPIISEIDDLDELFKNTVHENQKALYKQMFHMNKRIGLPATQHNEKWKRGMIIVTQPGDISLHDFFNDRTSSKDQIESLLFQLMYVLYVFKKLQISHGDCHFGNIMVAYLPAPKKLIYKITGKYYEIETDVLLKMYDYDHAMIAKTTILPGNNMIQINEVQNSGRLCEEYAECEIWNEKLDMMIALLKLRDYGRREILPLAEYLIPGILSTTGDITNRIEDTLLSLEEYEVEKLKELHYSSPNDLIGQLDAGSIDPKTYRRRPAFKDMTWAAYFAEIKKDYYSRIIRSRSFSMNNQMYIPDTIVKPIESIWDHKSGYFWPLERPNGAKGIDLGRDIVFTIDDN
jgi:hypothetical protein